jgi:hypothetical protein
MRQRSGSYPGDAADLLCGTHSGRACTYLGYSATELNSLCAQCQPKLAQRREHPATPILTGSGLPFQCRSAAGFQQCANSELCWNAHRLSGFVCIACCGTHPQIWGGGVRVGIPPGGSNFFSRHLGGTLLGWNLKTCSTPSMT